MIQLTNLVLESDDEKPIVFDCYAPESESPLPLVIFCHGYKGFKDWGAWTLAGKVIADAGFCFVKMNFSHNGGTVEQPIDFPDLEAFAQNNYSKELHDLDRMLDHLLNDAPLPVPVDPERMVLIGHSRGGGIVLIKASMDSRISKVVTWAAVSDFEKRFQIGSATFLKWKESGRMFVENGRTKQQMPHDWQFYEDFKAHSETLNIQRAVKNLSIPQLIIHGSNDPTVDVNEAKELHSWNPDSRLKIIPQANHVFGASHPWMSKSMPKDFEEVVAATVSFLKK